MGKYTKKTKLLKSLVLFTTLTYKVVLAGS